MNKQNATPSGFLTHAREFLDAGILVLNNRAEEVSLPAYFLLGRSVELSLKAFLLARGVKASELKSRKYGHNLSSLLETALERGIVNEVKLDAIEIGVIKLLNYDYMEKRFEYRDTGGTYHLPKIDVTKQVSRKLVTDLESSCSKASANVGT
jgi:hypothetical protein